MDAGWVEAITRWVGVGITLVGAFVVSPAATFVVLGRWRQRTVTAARRSESAYRRIVRRPKKVELTLQGSIAASGGGSATVTVTTTGSGEAVDESLEGRLRRLERRAAAAEARLAEADTRAARERAEVRAELGRLRDEQRAAAAGLHARLTHSAAQAIEVDAAALPVVALGVLVSGLSPDADRLPLVLWGALLAAAVVLTMRAVRDARRRRHWGADA